jgi:hypothetical protein
LNFKKAIYRFILFILLLPSILEAQVVVNFSPAIYGQTLDGLVYAQIMNSSGVELRVVETIKISEASGINVSTIKTAQFVL